MTRALLERHRRAGGRLPFTSPGAFHGAPFEGYFWRFTEPDRGRVLVALCGMSRGPSSSVLGLAVHPGDGVRWSIAHFGEGKRRGFGVHVGRSFSGSCSRLCAELPDGVDLRLEISAPQTYPRRALGAIGPGQLLPALSQYWQPVIMGGSASGELRDGGQVVAIDAARVYAERTWGHAFPDRWWWGQADAFDDDDVCLAFAGGPVGVGAATLTPTAVVVRLNERILSFAPPLASARVAIAPGRWLIEVRSPRYRVEIEGEDRGDSTRMLPVPLSDRAEAEPRAAHALAGRLRLSVVRGSRRLFRGESRLAGLEQATPR